MTEETAMLGARKKLCKAGIVSPVVRGVVGSSAWGVQHVSPTWRTDPRPVENVAKEARFENPDASETIGLIALHRFILNHLEKSQRWERNRST
jgi:hypothetical protein